MILLMAAFLSVTGCSDAGGKAADDSSSSDTQAVSSQEEISGVEAEDAVAVLIDGEKTEDVFLLQYYWYGISYDPGDSLNKTMMDRYAPKDCHAPGAVSGSRLSFVFDMSEEPPSSVKLTQYANTVRADSGIPYDTQEPELEQQDGNTYSATVNFRGFRMYYYLLECEWSNGNRLKAAFAVEKGQ